jgi:hypothetical protein
VTGEGCIMYSSLNVSRMTRQAGHVARMVEMRNACTILVGKPEGRDYMEDQGVEGIR